MAHKTRYVINIDNGTVNVRTSAHAENQFMFRPIDEETAIAINSGKVKADDVIEAINRIERSKGDFNWKEYDRQRRAAEKLLNVSRREMIPDNTDPDMVQNNEEADEKTLSLKELGIDVGESKKAEDKQDKPDQKISKKTSKKTDDESRPSDFGDFGILN